MAEVKVLIEGYAKETKDGWIASSTTTLVQDRGLNILIDPGKNRKLLLQKLKEENIRVTDIDYLLITHTHIDHSLLLGIFPNAKTLDDEQVYDKDREYEHGGKIPGTNLKILSTPGHDPFHCSLVMPTKKGVIVVAGDIFWWLDEEKQDISSIKALLKHKDQFVKDEKALKKSRKKVLEIADWIIPGHGKMFKNPRK